jgi:hypothetical protein
MPTVFDGMAGILNAVFGAPVIITPPLQSPQSVQGVFRDGPIEVMSEEGRPVWFDALTLQVNRSAAAIAVMDATVTVASRPCDTFRILTAHQTRSPANDAFIVCELERVAP